MPARGRRADAELNRARIVDTARAVLAESNGAVDELRLHAVAGTAGVGQGTLYRHFPTREHLLAEVYRQEMDELVAAVPALLADHPPLDALRRWFDRLAEYARVKRGVMAAIEASAWQELYADQHERLDDALGELLEQGRRTGELRADVDAVDVIVLLGALSRIPASEWDARVGAVLAVLVDGLRAPRPG